MENRKSMTTLWTEQKRSVISQTKLYDILMAYQERYHDRKREPLKKSEKVGDLNLELSRLYNQIWSAVMGLQERAKEGKDKKQMEVNA